MLRKEAGIHTFGDLLEYYPFRHLDKTRIDPIRGLSPNQEYAQVAGKLTGYGIKGEKRNRRLVASLNDGTGVLELTWFQGISWIEKTLETGKSYLLFGRLTFFNGQPQLVHPEMEPWVPGPAPQRKFLDPIYPSTEKLKARGLTGRNIARLTYALLQQLPPEALPEILPETLCKRYRFISRQEAFHHIHFPPTEEHHAHAVRRLKFDELFFAQLRLSLIRSRRHRNAPGWKFSQVGALFNEFYNSRLAFELTGAQKRVIREIRQDTAAGHQMNRLLQGDVGSGKTIVALLCMLLAAGNSREEDGFHFQSVLMAPTEILATQHYNNMVKLLGEMPVQVALLTGSTPAAVRKKILAACADGSLHILIGTHAVIEKRVEFANLGFAVVDEQHKFGVAQRARLWEKNRIPPHVLVMTATPIPRTLALTAYGDLDYSVIDELPPGRTPVETVHRFEQYRPQVMDFVKREIALGRQAYFVYPLIEESAKLDYENLMKGYEEVKSYFPEGKYLISMVHGKQPAEQKENNMRNFVKGESNILVSTTVIEVGVDVPNASVMVIESAEKFGLSQLHQLRGRVGRGAAKSFCILLTGNRIGAEARERLKVLCDTNDGFVVAEKDLQIRGPGDMEGTRQSGELNFKIASIVQDRVMLETARNEAAGLVEADPEFSMAANLPVKNYLESQRGKTAWSRIS